MLEMDWDEGDQDNVRTRGSHKAGCGTGLESRGE